ncbi:unnamed protein product [Caenorhabditis angaria]|uniref:Serpentine receptor class gamma n=1 Tax=Caenorhabditis angaria TaxID=860376 RepID=A0A9P1MZX8_9PELO|nr:unnamed protein product [Caenorhabditis angaria]
MTAKFQFYEYIQLGFSTIALVTLPLYISISYLIYSKRKTSFKTTFYKLLLVLTFCDILSCLCNVFGASFPFLFFSRQISELGTMWGRVYLSLSWCIRASQGFSGTLLAINRATAIVYPIIYKKIWPNNQFTYLLFCTFPGYPFLFVIWFADIEYVKDQESDRIYPNIANDQVRNGMFGFGALLDVISIFIIIISYFITLRAIRKLRRKTSVESTRMKNGEHSATRIAMIICVCEILYFIFLGICSSMNLPTRVFYAIFSPLTDIYSMLNCYVLIAFCPPIRNGLRKKKSVISFDDNLTFRKITTIPAVE